jgi:hypothetical protein
MQHFIPPCVTQLESSLVRILITQQKKEKPHISMKFLRAPDEQKLQPAGGHFEAAIVNIPIR